MGGKFERKIYTKIAYVRCPPPSVECAIAVPEQGDSSQRAGRYLKTTGSGPLYFIFLSFLRLE